MLQTLKSKNSQYHPRYSPNKGSESEGGGTKGSEGEGNRQQATRGGLLSFYGGPGTGGNKAKWRGGGKKGTTDRHTHKKRVADYNPKKPRPLQTLHPKCGRTTCGEVYGCEGVRWVFPNTLTS